MQLADKKRHVKKVLSKLYKEFPKPECALNHTSPFQLLVATILSAQCTDARVNMVTPALFKNAPDAHKMARLPIKKLEELVRSTGFYHNKARNILSMSKTLVADYKGQVPPTMNELVELPGVGRKTANVLLGNAFNIPGLVVDTHVTRISNLLGWVKTKNAVKIEKELEEIVPKNDWIAISHLLILHGRKTCIARRPQCHACVLSKLCPSSNKNE